MNLYQKRFEIRFTQNKNELIEAPKPKLIFSKIMKLLVKLPKMKTVSEYT